MELVLTRHFGNERYRHLDTYEELGGYEALRKAFAMPKEAIVEEVKKANLRGRGGEVQVITTAVKLLPLAAVILVEIGRAHV